MNWIIQLFASGIFKIFGETIVSPILNAYLKSKDVDAQKFIAATPALEAAVASVLQANVRYAEIQGAYVSGILNWGPFRFVLWFILAVCAAHFSAIVFDSTWPFIWGCTVRGVHVYGDACSWNIPPIKGAYGEYEKQYILFFIIAKPVDTLVSSGLSALTVYLRRK